MARPATISTCAIFIFTIETVLSRKFDPFKGAVWTTDDHLCMFVDHDMTPGFYSIPFPDIDKHPMCRLGKHLKQLRSTTTFNKLLKTQLISEQLASYETIHMINAPAQKDVYLHFYKDQTRDNVVLFTEMIPEKDGEAIAQQVAPQHFHNITYGLYTYGQPEIIVLVTHYKDEIMLSTGSLLPRRKNPAGFEEMYIELKNNFRKISFDTKDNLVHIYPVNDPTDTRSNLREFFRNNTERRLFYHAGNIYIYPTAETAQPDDDVIFFLAVPRMASHDSAESFGSPYSTMKAYVFFNGKTTDQGGSFTDRKVLHKGSNETFKIVTIVLISLGALIFVCLICKYTGIIEPKKVDRRTYFADDFIRKANEKAKLNVKS